VKTDEDMTSFDELYDMYNAHIYRFSIVRSETPVKRRTESAGGSVGLEKCPGCGNAVATGHAFCPYCEKNLKRTCPACGKAVEGSWKACPACGAGIDPGQPRNV
jgi:ribosomal protein L32